LLSFGLSSTRRQFFPRDSIVDHKGVFFDFIVLTPTHHTMATFDEEKHQYAIDGQSSPTYDDHDVCKGSVTAVTEAAAMYGSVEDAESKFRACQSARVASLTILQSTATFLEA
jgi:hypothetical protein